MFKLQTPVTILLLLVLFGCESSPPTPLGSLSHEASWSHRDGESLSVKVPYELLPDRVIQEARDGVQSYLDFPPSPLKDETWREHALEWHRFPPEVWLRSRDGGNTVTGVDLRLFGQYPENFGFPISLSAEEVEEIRQKIVARQ